LADEAEDVEKSEDSEDDNFRPVFVRRKSLLNPHTGEEEYFHPDAELSEVAAEGCRPRGAKFEDDSCGKHQPQHSLLSTAATSQADSGASSPRTPRRTDCGKAIFESPESTQGIRSSIPVHVARSPNISRSVVGALTEPVLAPGVRASTPGQAFCDSPNLSTFASQSRRIPLAHASIKPALLPHSSTPPVVFQSMRSRSVVKERGAVSGACISFGCQAPEDSRACAVVTNSGVQHFMSHASGYRRSFSLMTSSGSSSPLRLRRPSPFT